MTRSNFCSASLDTATSPPLTKVAGNGSSPAISLSMPLCMIKVPCLLVPFFHRGCASCILDPATSFSRDSLPPPATIVATRARDQLPAPHAGFRQRQGNTLPPGKTPARHRPPCTITPVPYRTEETNQAARGIVPRHEFRHFVLADSGWVRGLEPVPSMDGHYRNRCG
ncbi:hypothetical protein MPL3356_180088 [Mesorhizobium plurifarium]|uniref:Uncharacterized protein n=1 Tax=Mesorhizobium plurifarium TaxID=69974 RepID=A0A090DNN8_MESPL|nr:hypothetical protein MPL3356_180088 [Mesorhizobium plurifarium]